MGMWKLPLLVISGPGYFRDNANDLFSSTLRYLLRLFHPTRSNVLGVSDTPCFLLYLSALANARADLQLVGVFIT